MIILGVRTDRPQAELYLFKNGHQLACEIWEAHRELSLTIHKKIEQLLANHTYQLPDLDGIIFYEGPGSFTGLRIGASVVNALGAGLSIPAASAQGEDWLAKGLLALKNQEAFVPVSPFYGSEAFITAPKK